jgi:hypothetical protein
MSLGINSLTNNSYVQSVFRSAVQDSGLTTANTTSSAAPGQDKSQLSPFAQMMSTLQQLQQSHPAKYQQVTQQIATNLQNAAQTAQSDGDSAAADHLNQLAGDFSSAWKSGDLPNMRDMAKTLGAHRHGHGHHHTTPSSSDPGSANQTLSQVLAAYQNSTSQSGALDPMSIVSDTISQSTAG